MIFNNPQLLGTRGERRESRAKAQRPLKRSSGEAEK